MILRLTKSVLALVSMAALAACMAPDPTEEMPEPSDESGDVTASESESAGESSNEEDVAEAASALSGSACPCGDGWYCSNGSTLVRRVTWNNACVISQQIYCSLGCVHAACGQNDYCL